MLSILKHKTSLSGPVCRQPYLEVAQLSSMYRAKDKTNSPPTMTAPYTKVVVFREVLRSLLGIK